MKQTSTSNPLLQQVLRDALHARIRAVRAAVVNVWQPVTGWSA